MKSLGLVIIAFSAFAFATPIPHNALIADNALVRRGGMESLVSEPAYSDTGSGDFNFLSGDGNVGVCNGVDDCNEVDDSFEIWRRGEERYRFTEPSEPSYSDTYSGDGNIGSADNNYGVCNGVDDCNEDTDSFDISF